MIQILNTKLESALKTWKNDQSQKNVTQKKQDYYYYFKIILYLKDEEKERWRHLLLSQMLETACAGSGRAKGWKLNPDLPWRCQGSSYQSH